MAGVIQAQLAHRLAFAAFDPDFSKIVPVAVFKVDASIRESHETKIATTKHPVFQGIPVTDNARPEPDALSVVCFFSDTAVRIDDALIKIASDGPGEIREQMKMMAKKGFLWTVDTYFEVYENMLVSSLSVPHSVKTGKSLEMTINFSQVRKATVSSFEGSAIAPKAKENAATKKAGAVATEKAAKVLVDKTGAAAILDLVK